METKTKKSVHFASQDTEHTIAASYNKPERRFVSIEDETSDPSELHIAEKALKVLQDASKMRIDKQLVKLAKDGVIFLKAPSNTNTQRTNAMKLRTTIIKLLSKYQFVETVPHPKHDTKKSVEENEWIPEHAIKPRKSALKAIFVGSVGKNEPKWRSFWEWSDDSTENVAPESQSSYSSSPPPPITMPDDTKDLTFEQLSDDDKRTIYEWAVKREGTQFFKQRAAEVFESYAANESALDWEIKVVDPLWFRIQSAGSMVHTDTPYIARHTNALSKISGQKLMISGIDMTHKATFIGKKSKILAQKLNNNAECALCGYAYSDGDNEEKQLQEAEEGFCLCSQCCDSRFGMFTVWTALDYFDSPFDSGSMLFALGSHSKYKGIHNAIGSGEAVPNGYANKSRADKENNMRWGYAKDIQPGDQFIFNIKTLHASSASTDGYLRARIDVRVTVKPSDKRYCKELNHVSDASPAPHLGLSQLCSQPAAAALIVSQQEKEESPELGASLPKDDGIDSHKNEIQMTQDDDDDDDGGDEENDHNENTNVSIQDLPTQMEEEEEGDDEDARKKTLTPQDVSNQDEIQTVPETPLTQDIANETPSQGTQDMNEKKKMRAVVPSTQAMEAASDAIPRLEPQSINNRNCNDQMNINLRKRKASDVNLSQTQQPPNKRQKLSNYHMHRPLQLTQSSVNHLSFMMQESGGSSSSSKLLSTTRMNNLQHLSRMSDEELCRKISEMRHKNNQILAQLQSQMNETSDLMEIANERYLYTKQQYEKERERANRAQTKNQNLQKQLIQNHQMLFKMFEP
eukprot:1056841_1